MKNKALKDLKIERFNTDLSQGLTDTQVNSRISMGLINTKSKKLSKSYFKILFDNLFTFFNLLGFIVFIALYISKAPIGNFFFVIIFTSNILIGIIQEVRAKITIEKLSIVTSKTATVIRNGKKTSISPTEIVLDDLICFSIGNQITADCIIKEGSVEINESLLTGESVSIKKNVGDFLYSGSFITSGSCIAIADKVGKDCYVEKLSAKAKVYKKQQSELMTSLTILIKSISSVILPIALVLVIKSIILHEDYNSIIYTTSASVIGMIPSGMFLLTSMALAVGIIKLAKQHTLVQDLYSLEMLARVDTICFDKTGTITDGNMKVNDVILLNNVTEEEVNKIVSSMLYSLKDVNQTQKALLEKFSSKKFFEPTAVLPFNSNRKISAVTFENDFTCTLGAPEFIFDSETYSKIKEKIEKEALKGYRVIALAISQNKIENENLPTDFTPLSLITISDNIRSDAYETIRWFRENNVAVKVISGDSPITVYEVSKRAGIENAEKYISLEGLNDEEVYKCATEYTIFGRVSPEQKAILIKALKDNGHTTAMTGDGVNDILALKEADCAISVASGSEAARNVSNIVLLNNNFSSMPNVVFEGRRVINNVQSSASLFLMKTLFTIILTALTLILPIIPKYPFTPSNLTLLEIFVIGIPSFMLSFQPNKDRVEGKFITRVLEKSLPSAILMVISVVIILFFKKYLNAFDEEVYTTMAVMVMNFGGLISLFYICSPLNLFRSLLFLFSFIIITGIQIYTMFNGFAIFSMVSMVPFSEYWHHIFIVLAINLTEIPLNYLICLICSIVRKKINESKKLKIN